MCVDGGSIPSKLDVIYDSTDAIASYPVSITIPAFVQRGKGTILHFLFPAILLEGRVTGKKSNRREEGREGVEGRVF